MAWSMNKIKQANYQCLDEKDLRKNKTSSRIFIFGSGYSVNDISHDEWDAISSHDTLSFNWF
ncbi:MAG: hypothetical protein ABEK50_07145, partial [bacterium]